MRKKAVIIGGAGQDGIEMALFLKKKKNYELISIIRKNNNKLKRIINNQNIFRVTDLQNTKKLLKLLKNLNQMKFIILLEFQLFKSPKKRFC